MNVNVISSTENKLLDRKEIKAEVSFDGATPKRDELKAAVCQKIAINPDVTVLRKVESTFGTKSVRVTAYSYETKEALVATEPDYIQKREGMIKKEEKKKEEAPAPAAPPPKEEAPKAEEKAPEKKEEPKAEEKKEEKEKPPEKKEAPKEEPKKE